MPEMLLIGCKLPHGLVMELPPNPNKDDFMKPRAHGHRVTLNGAASLYNQRQKKAVSTFEYALTPVEKSFAEEWFKRNSDRDFIKNGFVFIADKQDRAEGIAKERRDLATGLEPLNGDTSSTGAPVDPRFTRRNPDPKLIEPTGI